MVGVTRKNDNWGGPNRRGKRLQPWSECSAKGNQIKRKFRKDEKTEDELGNVGMFSLTKLFDKTLLSELVSEIIWMDRLRRVIEKNDQAEFELIGPYKTRYGTNSLWSMIAFWWTIASKCKDNFDRRCWRESIGVIQGKMPWLTYPITYGGPICRRILSI